MKWGSFALLLVAMGTNAAWAAAPDDLPGTEKVLLIPHPQAAKGLESISADKIYQYKVPRRSKSQASTVTLNAMSPWSFSSTTASGAKIKYASIYPASSYISASGTYEYMLTQSFGGIALVAETGVGVAQGNAVFADGTKAKETFSLYMIPITGLLKYRFEYSRKQWLLPYIEGGATYVGMAEIRNDGQKTLAGSQALLGGGGLMFNLSGSSTHSSFILDQEYGIADMWLTLGARQWVGLKSSLDLTNSVIMAGVTVDY
jgi:hypothetical protein